MTKSECGWGEVEAVRERTSDLAKKSANVGRIKGIGDRGERQGEGGIGPGQTPRRSI